MKTAFATGPGFYSAFSNKVDSTVPDDTMRFLTCRIEAYDGPVKHDSDLGQTEFTILAAMAEKDPRVARALLDLHGHIHNNMALIKEAAKRQ